MSAMRRGNRPIWRAVIVLLILAHLALAVAYSAINPLGEAPDEADHWAYIVYLAREHHLPQGPTITQSKHPPLYHATAALVSSLAGPRNDFLRANPDVQIVPADEAGAGSGGPNFFIHTTLEDWPWRGGALAFHLARLWSALLSTLTMWAMYGLMRAAFPQRPMVVLGAVGVLAFLPEFAFIGGAASNDNAAALFGTLALWGGFAIYRAGGRFRAGWWTPLALGLGLWAKVSTVAVWPAVGLAVVLGVARLETGHTEENVGSNDFSRSVWPRTTEVVTTRSSVFRALMIGLAVFLPAVLIAAPWFLRNWRLYGDPLGLALARQTVDVRTLPWTLADTSWLLKGWFVSFWGKFGGAGQIPMAGWIYGLLAGLIGVSGLGLVRAWFRKDWREDRTAGGLLLLAGICAALGIWRYSLVALGTDQGRLLDPAVGALVGLWVVGLSVWSPSRWWGSTAAALIFLSLALGLYGLLGVIRPAFAPPPVATLAPAASDRLDFGELALVGWKLQSEPVLDWTVDKRPAQDWRTVLRVVAEDGTLVWEWKRSPGGGRWSTDHWPPGYMMRDAYAVHWPEWAGPGRYRVEVGAYPFGGGLVVPTKAGRPVADQKHPYAFLGWLER